MKLGPWEIGVDRAESVTITGPGTEYIATLEDRPGWGSLAVNAKLIMAVPEMIEALEAIEASNGYGCEVPDDYNDGHAWLIEAGAIRKVAKALAKVREEVHANSNS